MSDHPPRLSYAPKQRRRIAPSPSDCYVALFLIISAIAGLIGVAIVAWTVLIWLGPASLGLPEAPSELDLVLGLALYGGGSFAIAFFAGSLARRRLRPVDSRSR